MLQTNTNRGGNDAGVSVQASILTTTTTSSTNNRYKRLWKRTIIVGLFVGVKKKSSSPSPRPPPPTTTFVEELCRTVSSHSSSLEIVINIHEQEDEEKEEERPGTVVNDVVIDQRQHHLRDKVNRFVEDRDLKSLTDFGGVEQVATLFNSNLNTGLCVAADAANDLQTWNTTTANHPLHGFMHYFKAACNSYTIFLLLISAALTFGTEILMQGTKYGWEHGATILVAIFLLVTVAPMAEFHRAKIEHKEMQKKEYKVRVIRNGEPRIVGVSSIMLGDIVDLKEGDRVPADGLFVGDDRLVLDEVSSAASDINSHHNPFLLYGFKVCKGSGRMIVTSVGTNTVIGKLMNMVMDDPNNGTTLLQTRMERSINYVDKIALCISILITLVLFIRFLRRNHVDSIDLPELKGNFTVEKLMEMFDRILLRPQGSLVSVLTTTLTVLVLGFQHGVSLAITISLSYWNQKVASSYGVNPRTLSAYGTIGFITVICIDLPGEVMMEVVKLLVGEREINTTGEESNLSHIVLKTLQQGIGVCILVPEYPWSPMDRLLYSWAKSEWGVAMEFRKESSDCASSTSGSFGNECGDLCEGGELAKAAAMESRKECSGCAGSYGSLGDKCDQSSEIELANVVAVESRKMEFRKESSDCAGSSGSSGYTCGEFYEVELVEMRSNEKGRGVLMRKINGDDEKTMLLHWRGLARTILGMCSHYYDCEGTSHVLEYNRRCKLEKLIKGMEDNGLHPIAFAYKQTDVGEIREDGLILLAILGVKYREETKLAMDSLREAGMNIKLMMGDELSNDAHETFAFGRSSPEDKLSSIRYLKQEGHVVGFYGGFTTDDTPALKEADVGITEEAQSTEMARESSDIIVLGPGVRLSSLFPMLKHGRCVYHNIQRFIVLQLTAYISGILIIAVSTMSLGESPITTIHLGWANLIVYMLGGMMMAMELPTQGLIMAAHQPQPTRTKSIMTKPMWRSFAVQFVYQVSVLLIIQFEGGQAIHGLDEQNVIKTMIFNTFILCQVFNLFNTMELEKKQVFMVVVQSYCFLACVVAVLAVQVLLIQLATILTNYARLNWVQWTFCFLFSSLSWIFDRVLKFIYIFLSEMSVWSMSSTSIMSRASMMPIMLLHVPITGFSFSVFVFFSLSYYFKPDIAWATR
ncbi:hypothetical protein CsSME_00019094 [Camellia sinensis var. sinensis]